MNSCNKVVVALINKVIKIRTPHKTKVTLTCPDQNLQFSSDLAFLLHLEVEKDEGDHQAKQDEEHDSGDDLVPLLEGLHQAPTDPETVEIAPEATSVKSIRLLPVKVFNVPVIPILRSRTDLILVNFNALNLTGDFTARLSKTGKF